MVNKIIFCLALSFLIFSSGYSIEDRKAKPVVVESLTNLVNLLKNMGYGKFEIVNIEKKSHKVILYLMYPPAPSEPGYGVKLELVQDDMKWKVIDKMEFNI